MYQIYSWLVNTPTPNKCIWEHKQITKHNLTSCGILYLSECTYLEYSNAYIYVVRFIREYLYRGVGVDCQNLSKIDHAINGRPLTQACHFFRNKFSFAWPEINFFL